MWPSFAPEGALGGPAGDGCATESSRLTPRRTQPAPDSGRVALLGAVASPVSGASPAPLLPPAALRRLGVGVGGGVLASTALAAPASC